MYPLLVALLGLVFALCYVIVTLFASWGRRPAALTLTATPSPGSPEFLRALGELVHVPIDVAPPPRVLNNGDEIIPDLLAAIHGATTSVHIMVFIWADGAFSDRMCAALLAKARQGVEIRVLIDSLGGFRAPVRKLRRLAAAGAQVEWFRRFEFGKLTRFHRRNHRRAIVIDGRVGYTGGMSVSDEWLGNAENPKSWRDVMVRVESLAAQRLQGVFAESWAVATGEFLVGDKYYPHVADPIGGGSVATQVPFLSVASTPSDDAHPMRALFWMSFACATRRIYIANAYFVPDELVRRALKERARRGVDVRVLVPNRHNDIPPVLWAGRYYYAELLEAGVRIFEYQPTMLHSKFFTVDGQWSVVGSANLDIRSKELNEENVLAVAGTACAERFDAVFGDDVARATEVKLAQWRTRGVWWRTKEALAAMFAEQF